MDTSPEYRKLVKNYSCGRLCDYEDFESINMKKKFGSTPLFNIPTTIAGGAVINGTMNANGGITAGTSGLRKPKNSKSFTNNLYEKDYRKPSFNSGYCIPVTKSQQSLGRQVSAPVENYYAATDILKVIFNFQK